ncbi:MAG: transposase family protein, partial [Pseudomonadota bacterium]
HPFFDGTEQRINRPRSCIEQRKFYSGKKKTHMMKNQVVVYRRPKDGRPVIAAISPSREGKTHDKKIYDESRMTSPPNIKRGGDTGYQGK